MTRRSPVFLAACVMAAAVLLPSMAQAQGRRSPRGVTRATVVAGAPYFWYAYDPWFAWYPYGYWSPGPPYYGAGYYYDGTSSLRLQVTPRQTEVYIDGYYAGIVDQFDGTFQRLHLEPGEHELQLFLPGHRPLTQRLYLQPRATFRVRHTMEPLGAGEAEPPRPAAAARPQGAPVPRVPPRARDGVPTQAPTAPARSAEAGSVSIRVQPADAEILIDGEPWTGSPGDERLVVQLGSGPHTIEVRKDGYRGFLTEVTARPGESTPLNISLAKSR